MTTNEGRPGEESAEATKDPSLKVYYEDTRSGVYRVGAPVYRDAGWCGVLPLPPAQKFPPPKGFTGHDGEWPTSERIENWIAERPADANLMLRINYGLVGIDVDAYDAKCGDRTLKEAESRWGPLPPTFRSSARDDDPVSGIRVFKVPEGTLFRGVIKFDDLGIGDIEIVQPHHRFIVAWPSINPKNSKQYRWYDTNEQLMPAGHVPQVDDIPDLPEAWIGELRRDAVRDTVFDGSSQDQASDRRRQINEELYEQLIAMQEDGEPDRTVAHRVERAVADLTGGTGSRYDTTRDHVLALMRMRSAGHVGVPRALDHLFTTYVATVSDSRPQVVAEAEYLRFTQGAAALVASAPAADSAEADAAFWEQREILAQIRDFARSRSVAPYAVLGAVLRRAIALTPPWVQLPPTVGDAASVNLFTVSVGRSGQGKDAANGVGHAAVVFVDSDGEVIEDPPAAVGIGTGEGLAKALRPTGDDDEVPTRINLTVPEIGTLGAIAARQGATVIGELLKAYMGQALGFTNARRETTSFVPAHSYRLCLGVGAQPENAEVFMSRAKDGLPQRFLWLPTVDPYAPPPSDDHCEPVPPARVGVPTSFPSPIPGQPYFVRIPASARSAIRQHRHLVVVGNDDVDPLDGHLMLTRLKVGFGLALLEGRKHITDDDWRIAGQLIDISNRVRAGLFATLADKRKKANAARAGELADRQVIIDDRLTEVRHRRVSEAIIRKLQRAGSATRRDLAKAVTSALRDDFEPVFNILLENGTVTSEGDGRYELA
ncbi:bifunctional DNA primase/polymerase famiily protein [Mycobacteroides abscessus subsp. bolletii]|uniref:bifunctional DNA primase/polymerase n=1 Tax=Mycobacteroides abscessus TaxID=36809 RepID=UPI0009A89999|nr:bifunctional DNA primase/polymerase [Mycobacteroides abscessus]SKG74568.1 bifunctional DNA primase/polymerase famiily protein [Mycobacteroides abscessus subsp. bolletii]SKH26528.1 bifunctional DNA primase/polymerase famiily protein [Mycobacteroides abscessus subsp. bolletii]